MKGVSCNWRKLKSPHLRNGNVCDRLYLDISQATSAVNADEHMVPINIWIACREDIGKITLLVPESLPSPYATFLKLSTPKPFLSHRTKYSLPWHKCTSCLTEECGGLKRAAVKFPGIACVLQGDPLKGLPVVPLSVDLRSTKAGVWATFFFPGADFGKNAIRLSVCVRILAAE